MFRILLSVLVGGSPAYPLATVFVREGKISISSLGTAQEQVLETPGLQVETASISFSKTKVVFTATKSTESHRLYLLTLKSGAIEELETHLEGDHRDAVFSTDEKYIYFTAAKAGPSGPQNPTRLQRWDVLKKRVEEVAPDFEAGSCEFHPAPRSSDVLHVSTTCFGRFALEAASRADGGSSWTPQRISNPDMEIATSFDGTKVVYTSRAFGSTSLWVKVGNGPARIALTLSTSDQMLQPKFVCPRDVMFLKDGVPWVLNTNTLTAEEASKHKL